MPELPDLEVFSHNLEKTLKGKTVAQVSVNTRKGNTSSDALEQRLHGQELKAVRRSGKELHLVFGDGEVLALHMMLHGELHFFDDVNDHKFTLLELRFADGHGLALTDFQRQATVALNPQRKPIPDALEVGYRQVKAIVQASRATIKSLLMDQQVIRGIGNAYADEILWEARISPFSIASKLPDDAVRKLSKSIRKVLINAKKKIMRAYPGIIAGEVREFMAVHRRDIKKSPTGSPVRVKKSGSRKTYYTTEQKRYG